MNDAQEQTPQEPAISPGGSGAELFLGYEVNVAQSIPAFFIESTAPDNIDATAAKPFDIPPGCERLKDVSTTTKRIAERLADQAQRLAQRNLGKRGEHAPKLVFTVHGFNSPREAVLKSFTRSFIAVNEDEAIKEAGVVCVGYRWPSEKMGAPARSGLKAAPVFLLVVVAAALAIGVLVNFVFDLCAIPEALRFFLTAFSALMLIIPLTLFLLRVIVYFRDQYRALTYGVPDLVDIVRLIDGDLRNALNERGLPGARADLSFIGHSMGGFVVTNAVRTLSDVFSPFAPPPKTKALAISRPQGQAKIDERAELGKAFHLRQLVLVSPDIPSEVLMSGRANPLRSSVERFREAHLFSNEADEVLRNISTTANFFMLPTMQRMFGYRLGNVGVLIDDYGISKQLVDRHGGVALNRLRVGDRTLAYLYRKLGDDQKQGSTAEHFTFFDCTFAINDQGEGVVSDATRGPHAKIPKLHHLKLLFKYLFGGPDVHSGYFADPFVGGLIYRFACIGYGDSEKAYGEFDAFSALCKARQIKALRS